MDITSYILSKQYADANANKINALIGELPDAVEVATVVDYINLKTQGVASDAELKQIQAALELLAKDSTTQGSIDFKVATAIATVVDNADGRFDTLKEIANWILGDEQVTGAAGAAFDIQTMKSMLTGLSTSKGSVINEMDKKIQALKNEQLWDTKGSAASVKSQAEKYIKDQISKCATAAQGALADTALQPEDITSGTEKGTIAIQGKDINITGLGSAAFTSADAYDAKGAAAAVQKGAENYIKQQIAQCATQEQGNKADTALQPEDIISGTEKGTILVGENPIAVAGLGSAAFTDANNYVSTTALNKKPGEIVANKEYIINDETIVAGAGAEIFNTNINKSVGAYSHTEGYGTTALGIQSHAEGAGGDGTDWVDLRISGQQETNENGTVYKYQGLGDLMADINTPIKYRGVESIITAVDIENKTITTKDPLSDNTISGIAEIYIGRGGWALGFSSHAEGYFTLAEGAGSHAEGSRAMSAGSASHAEGGGTQAIGVRSHAEGSHTIALKYGSHAEGSKTEANGTASHAEGYGTIASNAFSHAEGYESHANGYGSHAEGRGTNSDASYTHTEGAYTNAKKDYAHSEGYVTEASGISSHAEGYLTKAVGDKSHAEGYQSDAIGIASHAEGSGNIALGEASHIEGNGYIQSVTISGDANKTIYYIKGLKEGIVAPLIIRLADNPTNVALITSVHITATPQIEVDKTLSETDSLNNAIAYIYKSAAIGMAAHAEGYNTMAIGTNSHAEGYETVAIGNNAHVQGQYNEIDFNGKYAHIVGNGTDSGKRSNAYALDWNGNAVYKGIVAPKGGIVLTSGTGYGSTIPEDTIEGQIFFLPDNIADTIIGQGKTSDGWYYQQFNSGTVKLWTNISISVPQDAWLQNDNILTGLGASAPYCYMSGEHLLPITLTSKSLEIAQIYNDNESDWRFLHLISSGNSLTQSKNYNIITYNQPQSDLNLTLSLYIIGTWK